MSSSITYRSTTSIETLSYAECSKKLRANQAASLATLLRRKMEIEQKMKDSLSILKKAHDQGAHDVLAVAQTRLRELKEIEKNAEKA